MGIENQIQTDSNGSLAIDFSELLFKEITFYFCKIAVSYRLTPMSYRVVQKTKAVKWEFPFNCFCFFGPPGIYL